MALLTVDQLQDLFMLYCNEGREEKVVLGLTDTMYKKRLRTAGRIDTISKTAFKLFVKHANASEGIDTDPDFIFMQNLGATDPRKPKFELSFEQFLDALAAVARAKYPAAESAEAVRLLMRYCIRPLYISKFGEDALADNASAYGGADGGMTSPSSSSHVDDRDDAVSVVTGRSSGATSSRPSSVRQKRQSRVVLTASGLAASTAAVQGPRVGLTLSEDGAGRTSVRITSAFSADGSSPSVTAANVSSPSSAGLDSATTGSFQAGGVYEAASPVSGGIFGAARQTVHSINPFSPEARAVSPQRAQSGFGATAGIDAAAAGFAASSTAAAAYLGSASPAPGGSSQSTSSAFGGAGSLAASSSASLLPQDSARSTYSFAAGASNDAADGAGASSSGDGRRASGRGAPPPPPPRLSFSPSVGLMLTGSPSGADAGAPSASPAARSPGPTAYASGGPSSPSTGAYAMSMGGTYSFSGAGGVELPTSPSGIDNVNELKYVTRTLIAVVDDLRAEIARLRQENAELKAQVAAGSSTSGYYRRTN